MRWEDEVGGVESTCCAICLLEVQVLIPHALLEIISPVPVCSGCWRLTCLGQCVDAFGSGEKHWGQPCARILPFFFNN